MSMYEASARVPIIVTGPSVPQGVTISNFTTLIDMAGASSLPDAGLQGDTLAPFLGIESKRGAFEPRPNAAVVEYAGEEVNTAQFMLRTGDLKYIAYDRSSPYEAYHPQLFNVTADPLEIHNLARSPEMKA